jgi:hypothetical protein
MNWTRLGLVSPSCAGDTTNNDLRAVFPGFAYVQGYLQ